MYTHNKLHTHTYVQQLLQKVYILFVAMILFNGGCTYLVDEYIEKHTSISISSTDKNKNFEVIFLLENKHDLKKSNASVHDLLLIQEIFYTKTKFEDIKSVTIFMPHDLQSWIDLHVYCDEWLFGGEGGWNAIKAQYTSDTYLANWIILLNPNVWYDENKEIIIEIYLHELIHAFAERTDSNPDNKHKKEKYWGSSGILKQIYEEWLTQRNRIRN